MPLARSFLTNSNREINMSEIQNYDWDQIWDYGHRDTPPIRQEHSILFEWCNDDVELSFAAVIKDTVGDYYSVEGWTDYTGWGCRDSVEWFGPYNSVIKATQQLSIESRRHLGFDHSPVPEDIYRDYES